MLDIGALDGRTFEKYRDLDVESIDLNPLSSKVKKQDFFSRDISKDNFDIVGQSLVLNFVQDPWKRGEMLLRGVKCLHEHGILYITLPKSCIDNSRYLSNQGFLEICKALGLEEVESYFSRKLVFYALERKDDIDEGKLSSFSKKKIVNQGRKRNNFSILFQENVLEMLSRSTPVSDKRSDKYIQDLVIPDFETDDFKLDSWGKEFENEIDQKLYEVYDNGHKTFEEYKKKMYLNRASLKATKTRILEMEESKSSRSSLKNLGSDLMITAILMKKEASKEWSMSKNNSSEVISNEESTQQQDNTLTVVSNEDKILSIESLPTEVALPSMTESNMTSMEVLDNSTPFNPPRRPIDLQILMIQRERLVEELKETNTILRDLNIESSVLEQDLKYFDQNLDRLSRICREVFKDFYEKLNKLKLSGYVNNYELDAAKKLTMFFKMTLSDTPPNPDLLAPAIDKIFGNESNYFVMPDINTVLAKVQQTSLAANKNPIGSRMNLMGSANNLKGSSTNLKGSTRNLRGSNMGLGDWNSNMQLANQSFMNLLDQK